MLDHITLRVADLPAANGAFKALFDQLEIEQTTSTSSFSVWGNFALTQTDDEHPIARRVHVAFIAPTPAHVEDFNAAGVDAGFVDDVPPARAPTAATMTLRRPSQTGSATPSKPCTGTVSGPAATSIRSRSASSTLRLRPRFTQRSAAPPDSRSDTKPLSAPRSRSAHQA